MLKFLIIKQGLGLGGTETLAVRMCNWLSAHGNQVYLLTECREEKVSHLIDEKVIHIRYEKSFWKLTGASNAKELVLENKLEDSSIIYGYGPIELCVAASVGRYMKNTKIMTGVYHTNAYRKIKFNSLLNKSVRKLFLSIPNDNILYMNSHVQQNHEGIFHREMQQTKIWPLPLSVPPILSRGNESNVIVSVGNLKLFKTYNFNMLPVIKGLLEKGYDLRYHIYGDGPERARLQKKIHDLGLDQHVFLKGQIPYQDFHKVVENARVFVGLGTAVLEASAAGIPSLMAVSYSKEPVSFGFVQQVPDYNAGTPIKGYRYESLSDLLEYVIKLDRKNYDQLRREGYEYVKSSYGIDRIMDLFLVYSRDAAEFNHITRVTAILKIISLASTFELMKSRIKSSLQ